MTSRKYLEIEQKYRIRCPGKIRQRLRKIKAKRLTAGFEQNELLDREGKLRKKQCVLRLRQYGKLTVLTFKGPRMKGKFKKRIEIETPVHYEPVSQILAFLGYHPFFKYTKRREIYHLKRVEIVLDWLKGLGWFLEIEGSPDQIQEAAKKLGLEDMDIEPMSYPQLLGRKQLA